MNTVHLIISGRVQGIGFRKWMKHHAKSLAVTGWIKNREDGAVESVIQGDEDSIRQLLDLIRLGPPLATIEGIQEEQKTDALSYDDFIVIQ